MKFFGRSLSLLAMLVICTLFGLMVLNLQTSLIRAAGAQGLETTQTKMLPTLTEDQNNMAQDYYQAMFEAKDAAYRCLQAYDVYMAGEQDITKYNPQETTACAIYEAKMVNLDSALDTIAANGDMTPRHLVAFARNRGTAYLYRARHANWGLTGLQRYLISLKSAAEYEANQKANSGA